MVICDTNIISKLLQKNPEVVKNINNIGVENIAITPIIFIEIYRWLSLYKGIEKSQRLLYKRTLNDFKMCSTSMKKFLFWQWKRLPNMIV